MPLNLYVVSSMYTGTRAFVVLAESGAHARVLARRLIEENQDRRPRWLGIDKYASSYEVRLLTDDVYAPAAFRVD